MNFMPGTSYVPGVILDRGTVNPVSTQKTGFYFSTAGDGMSGLGTASRRLPCVSLRVTKQKQRQQANANKENKNNDKNEFTRGMGIIQLSSSPCKGPNLTRELQRG